MLRSKEAGGVDEGVVVDAASEELRTAHALVAVHEDVAGDGDALRDFQEEAVEAVLDPVVHEHAVHVADVVPDAVGIRVVDDEVVAADDAVGLVEDLHGGRVVAGDLLDVVAGEDVFLEQAVGRSR